MKQLSTAPQLLSPQAPRARALQEEKPPQREARTAQLESSPGARALQEEKPPRREARTAQLESSPGSLQLEKAQAQQ